MVFRLTRAIAAGMRNFVASRWQRWRDRARKQLLDVMVEQLNRRFEVVVSGDDRAKFFDPQAVEPRLLTLDRNFATIRRELDGLLTRRHQLAQYHDLDPVQQRISKATPGRWNVFVLHAMGKTPPSALRVCPQTCALLDTIPNKFEAFFSILEARKSVPAHHGPYLGYLRYHLGLKVPADNPPSIRVEDRRYTWREGESMIFDDSWEHEVDNQCDELRAILVVDILRPMPWWPDLLNRTASRVGFDTIYGKQVARRQESIFGS